MPENQNNDLDQLACDERWGELVAACKERLPGNESDPRLLALAGAGFSALGEHQRARDIFERLVEVSPRSALAWSNLATTCRACGDAAAACAHYERALDLRPDWHELGLNFALLLIELQRWQEADLAFERIAEALPTHAVCQFYTAFSAYQCAHWTRARKVVSKWAAWLGMDDALHLQLALLMSDLGMTQDALNVLNSVSYADQPKVRVTRAQLFERLNRTHEAMDALASAQALDAGVADTAEFAIVSGTLAEREKRYSEAVAWFARACDVASDEEQFSVLFRYAQALDKLQDYSSAEKVLRRAHAAQRRWLEGVAPPTQEGAGLPLAIAQFPSKRDDISRWTKPSAEDEPQDPVFIVAFPRSGTTFLEQLLQAHPGLYSMDEQPYLQHAIDQIAALGVRYPEQLADLQSKQLSDIRAAYWEAVKSHGLALKGARLVDKNPLNLLRLPAIARLFPNAKVILVRRDPRDIVLSCCFQDFRAPEFATMCLTPTGIARTVSRAFDFAYDELQRLPISCLELAYEDLVTDLESQVQSLCRYLDIEPAAGMYAPHEAARAVGYIATPSYAQVAEPVHQKSVRRWANYADLLAEATPQLETLIARWDY